MTPPRGWVATMRRFSAVFVVADVEWLLVGLAGLGAFAVGCVGVLNDDPHAQWSDAVYVSLQLFVLNAPNEYAVNVWLDTARFLAPAVSGYATLRALGVLFRDRLAHARIPLMRDHVVLCGLGYVGTTLLRCLREAGIPAVVIERDALNPFVGSCRAMRVPVVIGDARLPRVLNEAGLRNAARLIAVSPEDAANTEIVAVARQLANSRRAEGLRCLAQISHPDLGALLRIQEANLAPSSSTLDFFNVDEIGAGLWLDDHPIECTSGSPNLMVSTLDALGGWLVQHAARRHYDDHASTRLWVTVVDDAASQRIRALCDAHPALESICAFVCLPATVAAIRGVADTLAAAGAPALTRAYVSSPRDEQALESALLLRHELPPEVPVTVALARAEGVTRLITEATANGRLEGVEVFSALTRTCTMELVEGGSFDAIAVAIHRDWRSRQARSDRTAPTWHDLEPMLRESNRAQARDIAAKLRSVGCEIAPLRDWGPAGFAFTDAEVESLAIAEHDRWRREREDAGWRLGASEPGRRTNPFLIPFGDLPADVAEWNRDFVRSIPRYLAAAGLRPIRMRH